MAEAEQTIEKRSKYGARKTACALGHVHDSGLEAGRCADLHLRQERGEISRLELQPEYPAIVNGQKLFTYRADFSWFAGDLHIAEDVKGFRTRDYIVKLKVVKALYPYVVFAEWPPRKRRARKRKAA